MVKRYQAQAKAMRKLAVEWLWLKAFMPLLPSPYECKIAAPKDVASRYNYLRPVHPNGGRLGTSGTVTFVRFWPPILTQ